MKHLKTFEAYVGPIFPKSNFNQEDMDELHEMFQDFAVTYNIKDMTIKTSRFITSQDDAEHILVITDNDSKIIYLGLPADENFEYFVSVDKNGNILIPKEAYDEDLDLF